MPGPPPKSDNQRRRRNAPVYEWLDFPNTPNPQPTPPLPRSRAWPPSTRKAWASLWALPQSREWGGAAEIVLERWATLHAHLVDGTGGRASAIAAEMRALEDRHGVSPKAMQALRWRLVEADDPPPARRRRNRWADLHVVDRPNGAA